MKNVRTLLRPAAMMFLLTLLFAVWFDALAQSAGGSLAGTEAGRLALERGHYATAMRIWTAAAEQGDARAQNNIGYMHEHGFGVAQSYARAMEWYRRAANTGLAHAQHNIGMLYHSGYGVAENHREALRWFRLAAEQTLPEAQYMLGLSYHQGYGQPVDLRQALGWYLRAAANGYALGQYMAAYLLLEGEAIGERALDAHVWATVASAQGYEDARLIADLAELKLSAAELALAGEWAQRCTESNYQDCSPPAREPRSRLRLRD